MLHQRIQQRKENEYDTETGEYVEKEIPVKMGEKYQHPHHHNYWFKIVGFTVVIMLFFGAYMDISNRSNSSRISSQVRRKLKNQIPTCIRKEDEKVQDYVKCLSEGVQVLVISDTDQDKEIKEKKIYEDYDIHYLHLNTVFSQADDIISFLEFFENKSPWVFVDGSYIGNEKNLSEYYEHRILDTGIEKADIQPDLNDEEVKMLISKESGNISEEKIEEIKIRRNLRKFIPKENLSKHEILLGQYQLLQEQQKVLKEIELLNQLRGEESSKEVENHE